MGGTGHKFSLYTMDHYLYIKSRYDFCRFKCSASPAPSLPGHRCLWWSEAVLFGGCRAGWKVFSSTRDFLSWLLDGSVTWIVKTPNCHKKNGDKITLKQKSWMCLELIHPQGSGDLYLWLQADVWGFGWRGEQEPSWGWKYSYLRNKSLLSLRHF